MASISWRQFNALPVSASTRAAPKALSLAGLGMSAASGAGGVAAGVARGPFLVFAAGAALVLVVRMDRFSGKDAMVLPPSSGPAPHRRATGHPGGAVPPAPASRRGQSAR